MAVPNGAKLVGVRGSGTRVMVGLDVRMGAMAIVVGALNSSNSPEILRIASSKERTRVRELACRL